MAKDCKEWVKVLLAHLWNLSIFCYFLNSPALMRFAVS